MSNVLPNITPGEVVPGGFTYPNNAQVVGDDLYIRDASGTQIAGRSVSNGDNITVLDVGYTKQLVLVQYPAGNVVRQGYVTNVTSLIKYFHQGEWHNGSTSETVYDENDAVIGSLDPNEAATPLYKAGGKTHVVYNTSKGANTKSGYVVYDGGLGNSSDTTGITPGDVVPGGFTYPNNAQVVGDDLYIRDANGTQIAGRSVSNGDNITVLDVGYAKQLALVQYPAGSVVRQGYVTNVTSLIKYFHQGEWHNGSTSETVYDENNVVIGSIDPYESATPIYKKNGLTHVVYNTDKGSNTKSGFVKYEGASAQVIDIPYVTVAGAEKIQYGTSGKGRPLIAHKIGSGSNSLIVVCEVHGFEDNWSRDGIELVTIGNDLITNLVNSGTNGWSVYVIPSANPDGLAEGYTNNGPGRCTIVGGIDINRDFPVGFSHNTDSRNYTDSTPLTIPESKKLSDFVTGIKSNTSGQTFLIDIHGWEDKTIGNTYVSKYFQDQFGFKNGNYNESYQGGFLITWANSIGIKAALIELPTATHSHNDVVVGNYSQKITNAIKTILSNNPGTTATDYEETQLNVKGKVINVTSTLNVRSDASISANIIGSLGPNSDVDIIAVKYLWYKIKYGSSVGYVSKDYIQIVNDTTTPPTTTDDSQYWIEDTKRRGWGPITEEEYYKRINELLRGSIQQTVLGGSQQKGFDWSPSLSDYVSILNAFINKTTVARMIDDRIYDTSKTGYLRIYQYINGTRYLVDEFKLDKSQIGKDPVLLGQKGARAVFLKYLNKAFFALGIVTGAFCDLITLENEGHVHSNRDIAVAISVTVVQNSATSLLGGLLGGAAAQSVAPELPVVAAILGGLVGAFSSYILSKILTAVELEEFLTDKIEELLDELFGK